METIFNIQSFDRKKIRWEDYLNTLTPVEKIGDFWFKREDKFAPLGYGNINGTKLRQLIWLINNYVVNNTKPEGVVSGAVTGSPQHLMVASVAKHYRIRSVNIVGTKNILKHDNLNFAKKLGAEFIHSKIGYAKNLEHKAFLLQKEKLKNFFVLETNITVSEKYNSEKVIEEFHKVSRGQVDNIPGNVENLFIPAGSCNSVVSVLYGIAHYKPKKLKNIILMGIGSLGSKNPRYIFDRLHIIEKTYGKPINSLFNYEFVHDKTPSDIINEDAPYKISHYNLNGSGYCMYQTLIKYEYENLTFHPRYEAKMFSYIKDNEKYFHHLLNEKTCFWLIGSEAKMLEVS